MVIFIDTSALFSALSRRDDYHKIAKQTWDSFALNGTPLCCTNYLLVEAFALIQNRLGMSACQDLQRKMIPVLHIEWITKEQHQEIVNVFLLANRRRLSLVDCSSFETMRRLGIQTAFTFDPHFSEQGFEVIP